MRVRVRVVSMRALVHLLYREEDVRLGLGLGSEFTSCIEKETLLRRRRAPKPPVVSTVEGREEPGGLASRRGIEWCIREELKGV